MSNETQQHTLRAMAKNYAGVHYWDHLDSQVCVKAADEIAALEAECERLRVENADLIEARDSRVSERLAALDSLGDERDALAAQLEAIRAAGGEQVEVVGYGFQHVDHGWIFRNKHTYEANPHLEAFSLMTVAQHQRIVAAMAAELEKWRQQFACMQLQRDHHRNTAKALRAELEAARKQEPVQVVAVAVMRDDGDGGLVPDWLLEGGTAEMVEGMVLIAADDAAITGEDGHGEVFKLPPLAGQVSVRRELLRRVCWPVVSGSDRHTHSEAVAELRALLSAQPVEQADSAEALRNALAEI